MAGLIFALLTLCLWCSSVSICWLFGVAEFPDYGNYVHIAEGISEGKIYNQYFGEWVSRLILTSHFFSDHPEVRVNILTIFAQLFVFILVCYGFINRSAAPAIYFFAVLFFPLLMTTTIRSALVYVLFFLLLIIIRCRPTKSHTLATVGFGILSMSFHDSAFLVLIFMVSYHFLQRIIDARSHVFFGQCMIAIGFLMLIIGEQLVVKYIIGLDWGFLGRLDVYIQGREFSISKLFYMLVVGIGSWLTIYIKRMHGAFCLLLGALFLLNCLLFVLAPTPAIRFSIFTISAILVLLFVGVNRLVANGHLAVALSLLPGSFAVFLLQYDLLLI